MWLDGYIIKFATSIKILFFPLAIYSAQERDYQPEATPLMTSRLGRTDSNAFAMAMPLPAPSNPQSPIFHPASVLPL